MMLMTFNVGPHADMTQAARTENYMKSVAKELLHMYRCINLCCMHANSFFRYVRKFMFCSVVCRHALTIKQY